jgi:hypothetical protein
MVVYDWNSGNSKTLEGCLIIIIIVLYMCGVIGEIFITLIYSGNSKNDV